MKVIVNRKVLIWKSYGHVSVYALDTTTHYLRAVDELLKCTEVGGFEYEGNPLDLTEVVSWINLEVKDDWDLFEYLAVETIKEDCKGH